MEVQTIDIQKLIVNPDNDRHGPLANSEAAINWLFQNHLEHMMRLIKDIVVEKRIFERPLVAPRGDGKYIVHDGNRRISCAIALNNPKIILDDKTRKKIEVAAELIESKDFISNIECDIEIDLDVIDKIVRRRHTDIKYVAGQLPWDGKAKNNHARRTGAYDHVNIASEIEKKLKSEKFIESNMSLYWSNINRLLSTESSRNRFGISMTKGGFFFISEPKKSLNALTQAVLDISNKRVTLADLINNQGKQTYIDDLDRSGILPTIEDRISQKINFVDGTAEQKSNINNQPLIYKNIQRQERRIHLIPKTVHLEISESSGLTKLRYIWIELGQRLTLSTHIISISVMFRVFIEITVEAYLKKYALSSNSSLPANYSRCVSDLAKKGVISDDRVKQLKRFANNDDLISIFTLHEYVHSGKTVPSEQHLIAMWDNLEDLLIAMLKDVMQK